MIGKIVGLASAAAAAAIAYIGLHESQPSVPKAPRPQAVAAVHHTVGWIPLTIGVLIVVCVTGAVVSYLRRPPDTADTSGAMTLTRWHVLLKAYARGHVFELRRGFVDLPAADHLEAAQIIYDRWVATYGEPEEGVQLKASAVRAS